MGIGPADHSLNDVVQGQQRRGKRHVDPAPQPGFNFPQFDPEPCDGFGHHKIRGAVPGRSPVRGTRDTARSSVPVAESLPGSDARPASRIRTPASSIGSKPGAAARRWRVRRVASLLCRLPPAPWPPGAMPSTCASVRRRSSAAPRSSRACACGPPWPPSSCRARRPAARSPSIASIARCTATNWLLSERSSLRAAVADTQVASGAGNVTTRFPWDARPAHPHNPVAPRPCGESRSGGSGAPRRWRSSRSRFSCAGR